MDCSLPGSSVPWHFPDKNTGEGCHFLLQGDHPDPGIEPVFPASPALAGGFFTTSATWEAQLVLSLSLISQKRKLKHRLVEGGRM